LYSQNNPALAGNPELDPEIVNTYEVSVGAEFTDTFSGRVTGFLNDIKDSLNLVPVEGQQIFQNKDKIRSQGIETEVKYDFGKGTYLAANYTYQDVKNRNTDERYLFAPEHKGNVLANVRLSKYFNLYTNLYFQGKYARPEGDDREDLSGFGIVNVTLIARNFFKGLEVRGSVYNLLDTSYDYVQTQDTLPGDFPQPERNFMVELRYEF
jgi:iron complex outermembrane receptor protein